MIGFASRPTDLFVWNMAVNSTTVLLDNDEDVDESIVGDDVDDESASDKGDADADINDDDDDDDDDDDGGDDDDDEDGDDELASSLLVVSVELLGATVDVPRHMSCCSR